MKQSFDAWESMLIKEFFKVYVAPAVGVVALAALLGTNRGRLAGMSRVVTSWWKA